MFGGDEVSLHLQLCEAGSPDDLDREGWVAERKIDGVRVAAKRGRLLTRSGRDVTASFPELAGVLPDAHSFDGELITTDMRFESVLRRVQTEKSFKVEMLAEKFPARLAVFDVLTVNESEVREKPLSERRELLEPSMPDSPYLLSVNQHSDTEWLYDHAEAEGWEGIVLKDLDSPYVGGRSDSWLKLKLWEDDTFPILDHGRTDNDGFVIRVGIPESDDPQKVVVNGEADQADVRAGAEKAEIQYLETTDDGRLRKPSFKRVADGD